jgi:hypothetical protein
MLFVPKELRQPRQPVALEAEWTGHVRCVKKSFYGRSSPVPLLSFRRTHGPEFRSNAYTQDAEGVHHRVKLPDDAILVMPSDLNDPQPLPCATFQSEQRVRVFGVEEVLPATDGTLQRVLFVLEIDEID